MSRTEDDVATLDEYARASGSPSRSAALQQAVRHLRHVHLREGHLAAVTEWHASGEREVWEAAPGDGLGDAAR